jgi:hypothetical protein
MVLMDMRDQDIGYIIPVDAMSGQRLVRACRRVHPHAAVPVPQNEAARIPKMTVPRSHDEDI